MEPEELLNENTGKDKESPLLSLEVDLKFFNESIREVAIEIMVEGLSKYPIFIAHQHELDLGEMILDRHEINSEWTIHASTLAVSSKKSSSNALSILTKAPINTCAYSLWCPMVPILCFSRTRKIDFGVESYKLKVVCF